MTNNNDSRIRPNVTSYDTGNKPYKHDFSRGKWSSNWDFYAVALSHCFGYRHFLIHLMLHNTGGALLVMAYTLGMLILMLPLYFTQMFLGQFSSTGVISVFRIAPLFKGLGYISLFLNILSCSYFMVIASFPLYIIFESMRSTLPWSHCDNHFNTGKCTVIKPETVNTTWNFLDFHKAYDNKTLPIHEYLSFIFKDENSTENYHLYWHILLCTLLIWVLIGFILFSGVEMFGKIFCFITVISFVCMLLITLRISFVPESWEAIENFFSIKGISMKHLNYVIATPILAVSVFGAGWGNILTIASYNNFKEDIEKLSLTICFVQIITFLITCICYTSIELYLEKYYGYQYFNYNYFDAISLQFVMYALYFSHLGWPQFWTILFFTAFFLTQFSEGAIQILTIFTAILDEYEYIRIYKRVILGGLIGLLAIISIFSCTIVCWDGFNSIEVLYPAASANKLIIILIELLVILWIFGRLRFQRDVRFMTGKSMKSWKIWVMRLVTPIGILFALHNSIKRSYLQVTFTTNVGIVVILIFVFLKLTTILYVPGYMIYKIYSATGNVLERIKKLCLPNDWYPADPIERHTYEYYSGDSDIGNDLVHENIITETVNV